MLKPNFTKQFEKDMKKMRKRGKNLQKLNMIMTELISEKPLEKQYKGLRK
ncbi:MAG TPA: type II toxin-antitoxin system mRNA interferase toxin, RelE/StbE family [Desulfobacteraceae bacterium]|nr:type II toxin-antitoxin system mRNA interferase toxin, RelE/StbE family [Desulfobacteraceae bacterium]